MPHIKLLRTACGGGACGGGGYLSVGGKANFHEAEIRKSPHLLRNILYGQLAPAGLHGVAALNQPPHPSLPFSDPSLLKLSVVCQLKVEGVRERVRG